MPVHTLRSTQRVTRSQTKKSEQLLVLIQEWFETYGLLNRRSFWHTASLAEREVQYMELRTKFFHIITILRSLPQELQKYEFEKENIREKLIMLLGHIV